MSDRMSECNRTIDHLPPIENLPLRKRLGISIKKQQDGHKVTQPSLPLKKSWFPKPKYTGLIGNPLLWNNGDSDKYAPWSSAEDTIDSFKSAWLGTQEKEEEKDDKIDEEEEKYILKKSNSISSGSSNKRGRPSVSKRSYSLDEKSTATTSVKVRKNSGRYTTEGKLYCVCRQPYDATRFMIACDRCDDWFHGECIHINEKESEFIDLYFCTKCSKVTGKKSLWKPKCVNPACYKAARISSSLGHLSKYCSDSCGMQVARARLELVEMKRRQQSNNNSTSSMSIAKLTLLKQKQLRVQSFADKEDRMRLIEIGKEKQKIRDRVEKVNERRQLLAQVEEQVETTDKCQFDARLILPELKESKKCEIPNCLKHLDWKNLLDQEYDQERKEQFQLLVRLQEEVNQIKSRMRKRRNEKDILKELINGTIPS